MTNTQGNRGWAAAVVAVILMMLATAMAAPAQTFKTLVNFDGTDGYEPDSGLVEGFDGDLYGATVAGGLANLGTLFSISGAGKLTTLHSFTGSDGWNPASTLVLGVDGNFYGTTLYGGANETCTDGCGTIFRMTTSGRLTTLHNFDMVDGAYPYGALLLSTDGTFYGTTTVGGTNNGGTIFKITRSGTLTTIQDFGTSRAYGYEPAGGLVQGTDGNFYGTTTEGGNGAGAIFEVTPSGTLTAFHTFDWSDGATPSGGLVQAEDGNFYGTTLGGGAYKQGTVFKITPTGMLTTLYSFCAQSNCADGAGPYAGLVQATDGNFYGATAAGGQSNYGTVFKVTSTGQLTTLKGFHVQDGAYPYANLTQGTNGALYGTTFFGGINDSCPVRSTCGTVFGLDVGLGPFVSTVPTAGTTGKSVIVLGTNLTGATSVTFNGIAATFTVESATAIETTVPVGATTGPVQVVTPSGTLTSNVNFQVLP